MLGKEKKGKDDKNGKGKGGDGKDDKKCKGKVNANATEYFGGNCLGCKACGHMKKDCWWNETPKSGKDTTSLTAASSLSTGLHDHWNTAGKRRSHHGGRRHEVDVVCEES